MGTSTPDFTWTFYNADDSGIWILRANDCHPELRGPWVIGNSPERLLTEGRQFHPGLLDPDDQRELLVRYWLAAKGGPYSPNRGGVRREGSSPNTVEYVQSINGRLTFHSDDGNKFPTSLDPGEIAELLPETRGYWKLPDDTASASGVTIKRPPMGEVLVPGGLGLGYEYRLYEACRNPKLSEIVAELERPPELESWKYQMLMVFQGSLMLNRHMLRPLDVVYVERRGERELTWSQVVTNLVAGIVFY